MGESSLLLTDANNNLFYLSQGKPPFFYLTEPAAGVHNTIAGHQRSNNHFGGNNNHNHSNKRRALAAAAREGQRQQQQQQQIQAQVNGFANLFAGGDLINIMHGAQTLQQQTQHMMQQSGNTHGVGLHGGNVGLPHTVQANTASIADYLAQLIKDKKQLGAFPNVFLHVERILDEEICKVRASLFQISGRAKEPLVLPEPDGPVVAKTEKVYVPVKEHPDFNFVGRILGPRGMTAKQLEQETGCKIMVRGKGSMRDKKKEDANRGKPNWEHLNDELHVVISVEDTEKRADIKMQRAVEEVQKLLIPVTEGEDELKKRQLMELAIINGTYRDSSSLGKSVLNGAAFPGAATGLDAFLAAPQELQRLFNAAAAASVGGVGGVGAPVAALASPLRTGTPLGAPLILSSPRLPAVLNGVPGGGSGGPPPTAALMGADPSLLYHHAAAHHYTPADYHQYANALLTASSQGQQAMEAYGTAQGAGTPVAAVGQDVSSGKPAGGRRTVSNVRDHPYQRTI